MNLVVNFSLSFILLASLLVAPSNQTLKIINLITTKHCSPRLEQTYNQPIIKLDHGVNSVLQVSTTIFQGTNIVPNFKCFVVMESPANAGLIWTMQRATLNDNDTITLKSGTSSDRIVKKTLYDIDEDPKYDEVFTVVHQDSASSISIAYEPTPGPSPVNAGFDMAVTVYREKRDDTCGLDFDCLNNRCIASNLQCDGFNNCGNNQDEDGCFSATTWAAVGVLIVIAIIVLVLALLVWVRMSRG